MGGRTGGDQVCYRSKVVVVDVGGWRSENAKRIRHRSHKKKQICVLCLQSHLSPIVPTLKLFRDDRQRRAGDLRRLRRDRICQGQSIGGITRFRIRGLLGLFVCVQEIAKHCLTFATLDSTKPRIAPS